MIEYRHAMNRTITVIPAYEPDRTLLELTARITAAGLEPLIVDDGSSEPVADIPGTTVLRHETNRGKGAALKTAFRWLIENRPHGATVVTADADGQHRLEDILAIAHSAAEHPDAMTLGCRKFTGHGVPFRSRLGNLWTCGEFRLLTGCYVTDTQSGLRGFSAELLPELMAVPGERYEYEIGVLVKMAKAGKVRELPIETVYLEGNRTSHFRPLIDTFRTQSALFRAAFA